MFTTDLTAVINHCKHAEFVETSLAQITAAMATDINGYMTYKT